MGFCYILSLLLLNFSGPNVVRRVSRAAQDGRRIMHLGILVRSLARISVGILQTKAAG